MNIEKYVIGQIKRKPKRKRKVCINTKKSKFAQLFLYMKNKITKLKTGITSLIITFRNVLIQFAHNESTQDVWFVVKWMIGYGLIITPGIYLIFRPEINVIVVILGCGGLHYLFGDTVSFIVKKIKEVMGNEVS